MFSFVAAQHTNTAKSPTFFQRFQTEVCVLWVNGIKITAENAFNIDHFETKSNHKANKVKNF